MHAHAALNRIYRLVWSALHQTWVVASELARGRGKSNATSLISAALLVSLAGLSGGAGAAPQGGQVVSGSGSISASGATTTITQASDKLSINWQSFNVAKAETVNFVQPSASALAVNRILDTQGSQILGKINANGQVWLINPNGVLFGKDAQINVGGLVASTLNPDDASIGSARSNFSGSSTAGVVNLGTINTTQGGYVALLGHSVSNQGSISVPGGTVALGAGSAVSLNFAGSKLLGLEVTSNQVNALAENGGLIQADGGQVLLSAGARESLLASVVNTTGIIRADSVFEHNGKIVLSGGGSGVARLAGTLSATGTAAGQTGGTVQVLGDKVLLAPGASIDASGHSGGGTVLVGGDYQGNNTSVQNASRVYVASDTSLKADATGDGNGGKVVVWADGDTRFAGSISARGGAQGGNGGFVEVSGKEHLDMRGQIDVAAPQGTGGKVLLDPRDIVLNATTQGSPPSNNGTPDVAFADDPDTGEYTIEVGDITGYSELDLQATNDIFVNSAVTMGAGNKIHLEANNNVAVNAGISVSGAGSIKLTANADNISTGTLSLAAALTAQAGGISLSGANITSTAAGTLTSTGAAEANAGNISLTSSGNLNLLGAITANGGSTTSVGRNAGNITISTGAAITALGTITASGTAGVGTSQNGGVGGIVSVTTVGGIAGAAITASGGAGSATNGSGGAAGTITVVNNSTTTGAIALGALTAKAGIAVGTGSGGAQGTISVTNKATAQTLSTLAIDTSGGAGGNGGNVTLASQGSAAVTGTLNTSGTVLASGTRTGSNAGNVTITGTNNSVTAAITANGSTANGTNQTGGAAGLVSITGTGILSTSTINAQTGAATGAGTGGAVGSITLTGSNATVGAISTAGNANGNGGDINITTTGTLSAGTIATGGGTVNAGSTLAGRSAGNVTINTGAAITALGAITASGTAGVGTSPRAGGAGGVVSITSVDGIAAASAITASGGAGSATNGAGGAAGTITVLNTTTGAIALGALTARTGAAVGAGEGGTAGSISVTNNASDGNVTTAALSTVGAAKGAGGNITVSAAGTLNTNGASIESTGGGGLTSDGANAGSITLSGGTITLGASQVNANGGAGNGTSFAGGNGGTISVTSNQGGMTNTSTGTIRANGGAGSATDGAGGAAGTVTVTNTAASTGVINLAGQLIARTGSSVGTTAALAAGSITVSNHATTATTLGYLLTEGGFNGNGGDINITTRGTLSAGAIDTDGGALISGSTLAGRSAGNVTINTGAAITALGAITASGTAGVGTSPRAGGAGGVVSITSVDGIAAASAITASGGAGSATNGAGGAAGTITVLNTTTGAIALGALTARTGAAVGAGEGGTAGSISVTNNASDGNVTTAALTTTGGTKGAGGNITVSAAGAGVLSTGGAAITSSGGAGLTSAGRNAGNITLSGGTVTLGASALTATGGTGNGASFAGGSGGAISVTSNAGGMTSTGTGAMTANGGAASGTAGGAAGTITVTNAAASTGAINLAGTGGLSARTGASVGTTAALAAGSITINNNATTRTATALGALSTAGNANGNGGQVNITATGTVALGSIAASSGAGGTQRGDVTILAGDAITQTSNIVTRHLSATTAKDGGAAITLTNTGNDAETVNLQVRNGAGTANVNAAISYTDANAVVISGINNGTDGTADNVTLLAGGALTQSGAIKASTLTATTANTDGAAITLTNTGNDATFVNLQARNGSVAAVGAANAGAAISYTDATGFEITGINNGTGGTVGAVTLVANGAVTQSGAIAATGLALTGTGGAYTLNHASNAITTLAANTGSIHYRQSGALAVGPVGAAGGVTTTGTTHIETTGAAANLTLNNAVTSGATGDAIILKAGSVNAAGVSTGGQLINNVGTGGIVASSASGRYLAYSGDPGSTTEGVTGYAKRYNADATFVPSGTASTFVYRIAPTLAITANAGNKVYDGAAPTLTFDTAGLIDGDTAGTALTGSLTRTGGKNVLGGDAVTIGTLAAQMGYGITYTGASYSISKADLTVSGITASVKTYDGNTSATVSSSDAIYSGLIGTDSVVASSIGIFADKNAGTAKTVNLFNNYSGADVDNYAIIGQNTTTAAINRKALTIRETTAAGKTYDGNTTAAITVGRLSGFVDGEAVSATARGTFESKNAGSRTATAVYTLADGSGMAENYTLADTTHGATISKVALTYTANKASFNTGTTPTGLTGTVSGFVNNESQSSATTGTLAWTTPATNASGAGSYAINGSGLLADNYSFSQAVENASALTLIQSVSIVPVVKPPSLSSDTGLGKSTQLAQTSAPSNVAENINTLPATAAGSVPSTSLNVTKAFGSSGMLFAQGDGVRFPATYYQSTLADPAQNP